MKVKDVIEGQELVTARLDQTLGDVAELMKRHDVTGIPIVDDWGALAGLVTASTLVELMRGDLDPCSGFPAETGWGRMQAVRRVFDWRAVSVREAMTSDLVTVDAGDDVRDAARALVNRSVHRAVVLGKDRNVCGVLSALDFVLMVAEGRLAVSP